VKADRQPRLPSAAGQPAISKELIVSAAGSAGLPAQHAGYRPQFGAHIPRRKDISTTLKGWKMVTNRFRSVLGALQNPRSILLFGVLISGAFLAACGTSPGGGVGVGDPAPAFTLPSAEGDQVSLSDYRGTKPVLLYFHMADG
jgi:hypothetical protein